MKLEKPVMWLVNLLLSAFFAFGVLQYLEQLAPVGWEWYSRSLLCWPILLTFPVGLAVRSLQKRKLPLLIVSVLLAEALTAVQFPSYAALDIVYLLLAGVLAAVLFLLGLRGEEAFPGKLAVASLLVYVVACVHFFRSGYDLRDVQPLCWCGLAAFTLSLYSFNAASLYTGVHNARGGETMAIPSGIRGRNMLLLTGFLLVAMLIGSLGVLHRALNGAWHGFLAGVAAVFRFFASLSGDSEMKAPPTPTPTPEPEVTANIGAMVPDGDPTFITTYAILLCALAAVFAILTILFSRRENRGGGAHKFADWVRGLFKTKQILEYEDEVERTDDLRTLFAERRKKARSWLQRLRERPEKFEDMPDDRLRVRFAYKALLKSGRIEGWSPAATPNEIASGAESEAYRKLTDAYNGARYDLEQEVPPEAANTAQEAMKRLRGRR